MPGDDALKPSAATAPTDPTDPAEPTAAAAPPAPAGPAQGIMQKVPHDAPPLTRSHVEKHDVLILLGVSVASLAILAAFFWIVFYKSGLLSFPLNATPSTPATYFTDALEYRERRAALALMLRSFTTGFSFVVGLALATMGGIFILRQVTALTALNATPGSGPAEATTPEGFRSWLKSTQFSFQSYSPGVVFMLGGLAIIAITQTTALPVTTPEIGPTGQMQCWNEDFRVYQTCGTETLEARLEQQKTLLTLQRQIDDLARAAGTAALPGTATPQGDLCADPQNATNKEVCP